MLPVKRSTKNAAESSKILEALRAPAMRNPFAAAFQRMLGMGRTRGEGTPGDEVDITFIPGEVTPEKITVPPDEPTGEAEDTEE